MAFSFEGVYTCCKCRAVQRVPVELVSGLTFDDRAVEVLVPNMPKNWRSDGLGGYLCQPCYDNWADDKTRKQKKGKK